MDNNGFNNNGFNNNGFNNNGFNNDGFNNNGINNSQTNSNQTNSNGYNPYQSATGYSSVQPSPEKVTQYWNASQPPQTAATPAKKKEKKSGGTGAFIGKVVVAALIFGLVGGTVFTGVSYVGTKVTGISSSSVTGSNKSDKGDDANRDSDISVNKSDDSVAQTATGNASDLTDVSGIVSEVMPSIVAITNTGTVTYQDFWGMRQDYQSESCGSGFIIKQDENYLYIATNNHVVANADALKVQFADDTSVDATVRGTDASDDLAVVQVALSDIPAETLESIKVATIGDSDAVTVGSASIAIGNALGYGQSVTTGVISALNRTVTTQDETTGQTITNNNLIQTDAAINPGNSGGALLNAKGEVIGINSVKYASTEVEGIGYAIPMAYAVPILESLIADGNYTNTQSAYLGIQGGDVSEEMTAYNFPQGVYVASVMQGSGAEKAGLQYGDIITEFEGTKISSMAELQSLLGKCSAGDKVKVKIARQSANGFEEMEVEIVLSSASEIQQ